MSNREETSIRRSRLPPAPGPPRERHDAGYKSLFALPGLVRHLLALQADAWDQLLVWESGRKLDPRFVVPGLRRREGDLVWRFDLRGRPGESLCVWLEFQSTPDPLMAARMSVYAGLLQLDLLASERERPRAPRVLPLVLYNGRKPWRAARRHGDLLLAEPAALEEQQSWAAHQVLVVRDRRWRAPELARNWAAALFRLDSAADLAELDAELERLEGVLGGPEAEEMNIRFADWVQLQVWVRFGVTDYVTGRRIGQMRTGLGETIERILRDRTARAEERGVQKGVAQGLEQGIERGIERGLERGIERGQRELLLGQVRKLYGESAADRFAQALARWSDRGRLSQVAEWLITCRSFDELLEHLRTV